MSLRAPTTPYEAAWQQWNYGGGASRGEPMPRSEDYPDMFEEDLSGGPRATDMAAGESAKKRGKYDLGRDLRQLPVEQYDPSERGSIYHPQNNPSGTLLPYEVNNSGRRVGGQVTDEYGQAVYPGMGEDRLYASPASPDEVYGAYAPQPARPGMASNVMGGAMGNAMARPGMARAALGGAMGSAMGRPGMSNALLGGALGSAMRKPGLLKRAAGGLMGAMTLGQLNRRKGY